MPHDRETGGADMPYIRRTRGPHRESPPGRYRTALRTASPDSVRYCLFTLERRQPAPADLFFASRRGPERCMMTAGAARTEHEHPGERPTIEERFNRTLKLMISRLNPIGPVRLLLDHRHDGEEPRHEGPQGPSMAPTSINASR